MNEAAPLAAGLRVHRYNAPPDAACRLFCFPHGGGGLAAYRAWPSALPRYVELCSVEYPGRDSLVSAEPVAELAVLVEAIADAVDPLLERPCALFGHSLGALVVFELARTLRRRARPMPRLLMVSGRIAPHRPLDRSPIGDLPREEFCEELLKLDGTSPSVFDDPELLELLLPALRADFRMHESYHCHEEPPLAVPMAILGGLEDPEVDREELVRWTRHTSAGHLLRLFPGGHFYVHDSRPALLRFVSELLQRVPDAR